MRRVACVLGLLGSVLARAEPDAAPAPDGVSTSETAAESAHVPPPPRRQSVTDEDWRFTWTAPAGRWAVGEDVAGSMVDGGRAGVMGLKVPASFLTITPSSPDRELAAQARSVIDATDRGELLAMSEDTFHGWPALRTSWTSSPGGVTFEHRTLLWHRDGFAFQIDTYGLAGAHDLDTASAEIIEGLSILPGPLRPRVQLTNPPADQIGIGWRMQDGRYDSAISGVRVVARPGWTVQTPTLMTGQGSDLEVGLFDAASGSMWMLAVVPTTELDFDGVWDELLVRLNNLESRNTNAPETLVRGIWGDVVLTRYQADDASSAAGVECRDGVCVGHLFRSAADLDTGLRAWQREPPEITVLDTGARQELLSDLQASRPWLRASSPDWTLVEDLFWHRRAGFAVWLPVQDPLRVFVGDEASILGAEGDLALSDGNGLRTWEVVAALGTGLKDQHKAMLESLDPVRQGRSRTEKLPAGKARVTRIDWVGPDVEPIWGELATLSVDGTIVHVTAFAFTEDISALRVARQVRGARTATSGLEALASATVDPQAAWLVPGTSPERFEPVSLANQFGRMWRWDGEVMPDFLAAMVQPASTQDSYAVARGAMVTANTVGALPEPLTEGCPVGARCLRIRSTPDDYPSPLHVYGIALDRTILMVGPSLYNSLKLLDADALAALARVEPR